MSIQSIREQARKSLHDTMSRPASLYLDPRSGSGPISVTARYNSEQARSGQLEGGSFEFAQTNDQTESVILWCAQLVPHTGQPGTPPRNALLIFSETEGYWIDNVRPPHGQTVQADVVRADPDDLAGKTAP